MSVTGAAREPDLRGRLAEALRRIAQLNAELGAVRRATSEPIAVVGVGCRFPGGGHGRDGFWKVLRDGVDTISEFPAGRWSPADYYDPDPEAPGKAYTLQAGYVEGIEDFDAGLFGISPREAVGMDPQQRIALEVSWEALEDAGMAPDRLRGTRGAVFFGVSTSDYVRLRQEHGRDEDVDAYQLAGELSFVAGRISYTFGLHGASQVLDTACSSSLVALHQACATLRRGEADFALAGGVNAILSPYGFVLVSKAKALSPQGRCRTFDAGADGYVRGEGCGVLVLKRLGDAQRDGDRVLCVVRGSAVNHDGRSGGLTVPNVEAQRDVLRAALADAGLQPADVSYVEAHGTGTPLGDPIELNALDAVYGQGRDAERPLVVGSVKTNVGHLEAAAGIAGAVKVVLALSHRHIPPHLHVRTPNPNVDWRRLRLRVATAGSDWPGEAPRRAAVSSFGASGTNAHALLEEAAPAPGRDSRPAPVQRGSWLLPLSARGPGALRELAAGYAARLRDGTAGDLGDVCAAAARGRARLPDRLAVVAAGPEDAAAQLEAFAAGTQARDAATGTVRAGSRPRVAFLFSGQGSQYPGMGLGLHRAEPVYRAALDRCEEILREHLDISLLELLRADGPGERLARTAFAQPALFALEYALARMWLSWGVRPAALLGHSVGEYVAACVAGALPLEDGLRLVAARGRLMHELPPGGAMAALGVAPERLAPVLEAAAGALALAAVNAPTEVVVAGTEAAVAEALATFERSGVRSRRLEVSHAFHSPLVEPMLEAFRREVATVAFSEPEVPVVSNVTGEVLEAATLADPDYWVRHARECVRFADGVGAVVTAGCDTFLEIGPARTLLPMVAACLDGSPATLVASLRQGRDDERQALLGLATLHARGVEPGWDTLCAGRPAGRVDLPTYPFQRERYFFNVPEGAPLGDGWTYELRWREAPRAGAQGVDGGPRRVQGQGPAVFFAPGSDREFAAELAAGLAARFGRCLVVRRGERYACDGDVLTLDPGAAGHWERLATDALACAGAVVFGWGIDVPAGADTAVEDLGGSRCWTSGALVRLVQGMHAVASGTLWVLTRGAQPAGRPAALAVAAGPLWGLGRVVSLEHPERYGGLLDLDPAGGDPEREAGAVCDEVAAPDGEDQLALREGSRLVPRLVPAPAGAAGAGRLQPRGAYLITGGLGGLGLTLARWLVAGGASHLTITSRQGLPAEPSPDLDEATNERIAAVESLRQAGATVTVVRADAADAGQMTAVLKELREHPDGLRGVVHAAGVSGPQDLADVDLATLEAVQRPKVEGAWLLHELCAGDDLDCFVLFSSIASAWGSQRVASYASANAFLDTLAHHRHALGLPATSIDWGPWMVASGLGDEDVLRFLRSVGLRPLEPGPALETLGTLVAAGHPQTVVADVDWATFKPMYCARLHRPLLDAIDGGERPPGVAAERSDTLERVLAAPPARRVDLLAGYLQGRLAAALRTEPAAVEADADVLLLGVDSLMAMEVIGDCKREFGVALSPQAFFEHPHVRDWAAYLLTQIEEVHAAPPAAGAGAPGAPGTPGEAGADYTDPSYLDTLVRLDERVQPPGGSPADQREPGAVLLTGATGFVGAFVLAELLRQTSATVHCLVRAPDAGAARTRVRRALEAYELACPGVEERVVGVPGDLERPLLGLGGPVFDDLARTVDAVYHAGAAVNFTQPYAQLAGSNVEGTAEVLRLACTHRPKPVNHVSTYGVWGMLDASVERVTEDGDLHLAGRLINGYVQSKWVAERVVWSAAERGVPVRVLRPGRVMGDRRRGSCLTTSFTCRIIKGCIQLGMAPRLDKAVEMTPVCYVAEALVHIGRHAAATPAAFHLVNPETIAFEDLTEAIRRRGWPLEAVDPQRWWDALVAGLDEPGSNDLHPLMDGVAELLSGGEELVAFGTANTDSALRGSGIVCPPLDAALLDTYFDYFVRTGYLPDPQRSGA